MRRLLLLLLPLALLTACDFQQNIDVRGDVAGSNPASAPQFSGAEVGAHTASGASFSLAADRGKVVVVDFWGSWCGPCRDEQPDLNALATRYAARGVVFVGVALRDQTAAVAAYQSDLGVPYPTVLDGDESIAGAYNVASPPTVVVIDPHGHIVKRFLGTTVGLSDAIDQAIAG